MRDRITILREIMEIEKKYALEEVDSGFFETRMQVLEKQLHETTALTDEEFRKAVYAHEIPLSADRLVGKISIEDLLHTFKVPRTFFRHMKIRREILELERNIRDLQHNLQKVKILLAEKKINNDAATIKIETLEFDLRLANNRFGARQKYLKRNPTKGELINFTLENYLKFSFGHGISTDVELKQLTIEMNQELTVRKEYRHALAEMLATMKTTQLDISTTKQRNGLPDFKQLLNYQQMINELQDYISLLSNDIKEYTSCLSLVQRDILRVDESHELFVPESFGIEVGIEEDIPLPPKSDKISIESEVKTKREVDPLLQSLKLDDKMIDPISLFLIDTTDSIDSIEVPEQDEIEEISEDFTIPETPHPVYVPVLDLEIIGGMEDFNTTFEINGSSKEMNVATKNIIFQSFEGLLEKLIDKTEVTQPKAVTKTKLKITKLSTDLKQTQQIQAECEETNIEELLGIETSEDLEYLTDELIVVDAAETTESIIKSPEELIAELEAQEIETPQIKEDLPPPPPPPPPPPKDDIKAKEPIVSIPEPEISKEIIEEPRPKPVEPKEIPEVRQREIVEDVDKPRKSSMISPKLLEASSEAWKLTGKGLFDLKGDNTREFLGYIQEVIVYEKNKLGFILTSELSANQSIVDIVFDQIKPLWVTEELLESAEKRKNYVINEVMESLQVPRDVALHLTKLQEFANFRNIDYPEDEKSPPPEIIGIVPIDKLRLKRGALICSPNSIIAIQPYRTAPWDGKILSDEKSPIGKECCLSKGQKIGKVISAVNHPLLGKILLIDAEVPNRSLIDYLVKRLEINEQDTKEQLWLVKYLIAKQLRLPEGDVLKAKTLISYSLSRGFPILPNEILNSFRLFVSGGSIEKTTKKKVTLKNTSRIFQPSEIYPLDCLRVRSINGRHLGTCLGLSLSDNPVLLISEKLSREIIALFTNATLEKEIMNDISKSVTGTIGVGLKDSLCIHNILKTLIVGKKIQTLAEYGTYLSHMNVTGIDLADIQVVEQGTIYIKAYESPATNIFEG
ncbi:MAG: hypothetical protein FK730_01315 [Asgard group archaeon]|nr:hypothetical protein [Asgard group archaeon]